MTTGTICTEIAKTSGFSLITVAEAKLESDTTKFWCEFCAKQFDFIKDGMEQVVVEPLIDEHYHNRHPSSAMRCKRCKARNRQKTFNGRKLIDPEKYGQMDETDLKVNVMPKRKVVGLHGWHD